MSERRLPPWLIGLVLAAILFVIALFVLDALEYGDDPVIGESLAPAATAAL